MIWGFVGFISRSTDSCRGEKTGSIVSFLLWFFSQELMDFAFVTMGEDYNQFDFFSVKWIVCSQQKEPCNKSDIEVEITKILKNKVCPHASLEKNYVGWMSIKSVLYMTYRTDGKMFWKWV